MAAELSEPGTEIHGRGGVPVQSIEGADIVRADAFEGKAPRVGAGQGGFGVDSETGLPDRVIFLGTQSRVEAVLPCADLMLVPSEEESFGMAALEALACGVPVVGTAGTGLSEVVDDFQNGFLLPVGDTTSMARAGLSLLRDKKRLDEFKANATRLANDKFRAERIVGVYEEYYREVINGG